MVEISEKVRVRFAPSPTGELHIGGARTALFNWLFAKRHGGTFVLRVEDTDQARSTEKSVKGILDSMKWLGLDWDEGPEVEGEFGPYFQSERKDLYLKEVNRLLEEGKAYRCYCTKEELDAQREKAREEHRAFLYNGHCRKLTVEQEEAFQNEDRSYVIRIRTADEGKTVVHDLIRGDVEFDNSVIDDFIVLKSDGMPTYNFACVIDDASMKINYILRAEEHLSNTPKQIAVYKALGYELPNFAHVPMILAPDRSKLSKRHGATSVEEFKDQGYLPEGIINYIALLGWSPGDDREIMSTEEIISEFKLERIGKNASIYDVNKMTWINGHYLREMPYQQLAEIAKSWFVKKGYLVEELSPERQVWYEQMIKALQDRAKTLVELVDAAEYFFIDVTDYEEKGVKKHFNESAIGLLDKCVVELEKLSEFTVEATEKAYRVIAEDLGVSAGKIIHPTRLSITGRTMGPGLFDIMVLLGKDTVLKRMKEAIKWIEDNQ